MYVCKAEDSVAVIVYSRYKLDIRVCVQTTFETNGKNGEK